MSVTLLEFVVAIFAIIAAVKLGAIVSPIVLKKLNSLKNKTD
jgi:hypothetical protein